MNALRAANVVEATAPRVQSRKAARVERPVTTRIREKREETPAPVEAEPVPVSKDSKIEQEVTPVPEVKPGDFRQRVGRKEQGGERQMRLF